jgi:hypothetical protein
MSIGLSIVVLAGWGSLLMAISVRAFAWVRVRAADKSGRGAGLVRLLVGIAAFVLIAEGARGIASLLHNSQPTSVVVALIAAGGVLAIRGARATRRNITSTARPPTDDLRRVLEIQVALLLLYGFYGFVGAAASPSSPHWGAFALMGLMWLVVTLLLVVWWREGRHRLTRRAVIWALVAWTTVFIPFLTPWERSRRLLVPAPRGGRGAL